MYGMQNRSPRSSGRGVVPRLLGSDVPTVYTSRITIERLGGGVRVATMPVDGPVLFGMHDEVAQHYRLVDGDFEPHSTTLDYVVAAAGG